MRVREAQPGMCLALPVYHPQTPSQILLRVGFELTDDVIARLEKLRVRNLWVGYPGLDVLAHLGNRQLHEAQNGVVREVFHAFQQAQRQTAAKLPFETYTKAVTNLLDQLLTHPRAAIFLDDLIAGQADDLMRHSSTVTYLSALIGLKLEGYLVRQRPHVDPARAKSVVNLGLGAMLHDLGVTRLDPQVREQYAATFNDRDPDWQEHTKLGYQLIRDRVDASAATVLLNHHQRCDGLGYAGRGTPVLAGERIHVFARIVAAADQFDRLRHETHQDTPRPAVVALRLMLDEAVRPQFDPHVLMALLEVAPPYPPGSLARLSDGRQVVVIDHNPASPCRPIVQELPDTAAAVATDATPDTARESAAASQGPIGEPIDLSQHAPSLHIAEHDGHAVAKLNFDIPPALLQQSGSDVLRHAS